MRLRTGFIVQLSVAVGPKASAAARPATSLHSKLRSRLPATVTTCGAVVSRTTMVCTNVPLIRLHPSFRFHRRTRVYPLAQPLVAVVTSLNNCNVGLVVQLSFPLGASASAAAIPARSLHSRFRSRLPATVAITGGVVSCTVIVCTKLALVFPCPSPKFHVRTRTYPFAHAASGVVTSLTKFNAGAPAQLSVAEGNNPKALAIPTASLHSNVRSRLPALVVTTGGSTSSICAVTWHVLLQPDLVATKVTV